MYDLLARLGGGLKPSYYMGKMEVLEKFPMLNREGLKGAIVYYDGMHNDARMNLNIALTAATKVFENKIFQFLFKNKKNYNIF